MTGKGKTKSGRHENTMISEPQVPGC